MYLQYCKYQQHRCIEKSCGEQRPQELIVLSHRDAMQLIAEVVQNMQKLVQSMYSRGVHYIL